MHKPKGLLERFAPQKKKKKSLLERMTFFFIEKSFTLILTILEKF